MSHTKRQVREVLDRLPDDCSIEDVQYHLYIVDKIRRRQEAVERGEKLVPQSAAEERLRSRSASGGSAAGTTSA